MTQSVTVDFYFDFTSPYSYLAHTQLGALAQRHDALLRYRPIPVLDLMARVGNRPTSVECKAKARYAMADLGRWARKYGVPIAANPHLRTMDPHLLLRASVAASPEQFGLVVDRLFEAVWAHAARLDSEQDVMAVLGGVDANHRGANEEASASVQANLEAAIAVGVFGVPSFVLNEKSLYFGNDRLAFLENALEHER
jgi:2-hydroxychromene-2-carboxylate isomerase